MIYALRNTSELSNLILDALADTGQNIRKAYQRRLPSNTSKDYYFIHRDTGITQPVIVEYGFLDSTGDDVTQLKNNYEEYAGAVVKAVLEYIGYASIPEEGFYIVKSGDTLWSIAKNYGVNVNDIKQLNNLTSNLLSVGQQLKIPGIDSETSEQTYVVKSGDSLYSIANRYNLSVNELKSYNNLTSNNLRIGQLLKIPTKEITEETITTDYITHTVVSGDTLYSLANKYNTTVSDIIETNNLTSTSLSIGQQLKIPTKEEIETESYTIYSSEINGYIIIRKEKIYEDLQKETSCRS